MNLRKKLPEHSCFIYALLEPGADPIRAETWIGNVRYVGQSYRVRQRVLEHRRDNKSNPHRSRWLKGLEARGLGPVVVILEECCEESWKEREYYWEQYFRARGERLTNIAICGARGIPAYEAGCREKMRAGAKTWQGFVDPLGNPAPAITNLEAFCRENGLCGHSMRAVFNGKTNHHKGWTCQNENAKDCVRQRRWRWEGFVNPEGHPQPPFINLREFCKQHGLCDGVMRAVFKGSRAQHKGWTFRNEETGSRDHRQEKGDPSAWDGFVDLYGNPVEPFSDVERFAQENRLDANALRRLYYGKLKSHWGYTCQREAAVREYGKIEQKRLQIRLQKQNQKRRGQ